MAKKDLSSIGTSSGSNATGASNSTGKIDPYKLLEERGIPTTLSADERAAADAYELVAKKTTTASATTTTSNKPTQLHHYATNKNQTYTQQFDDIAKKYGLDLNGEWNKEYLPHQGRHPNEYHDFVLDEMQNIDNVAQGDRDIFLELYESQVKAPIRDNPDMLYKAYWSNQK